MKHFFKSTAKLAATMLAVALCISTIASAAGPTSMYTDDEVSALLEEINSEYGTSIRVVSGDELAQLAELCGADMQPQLTNTSTGSCDLTELEKTLRHIAEVEIPQFERTTQEAIAFMERIGIDPNAEADTTGWEENGLERITGPVTATKAIDYAIAGADAYITEDAYGNTIWGRVLRGYCSSNMYMERWFMAPSPVVTHIDAHRTLYWTGEGDYYAYIDGIEYLLYSGTQYASMWVGNYA